MAKLLSTVAFKFNLRHYTVVLYILTFAAVGGWIAVRFLRGRHNARRGERGKVGRCRLTVSISLLKASMGSALETKM